MSSIDEIKEKLDIVQLISEYIQLKKVGANYRALCPFHSEKTPSFYVSPSRQLFKCFGCGKSGNIFDFTMEIEGVEFKEALQILAKKAGVELKKESIEKRTEKQRLSEICELATAFFETQLDKTQKGKEAKEYLISRNISEESIQKWRIGYAPNTWQGLSDFLVSRGYKREEAVKAGLAVDPNEGNKKEKTPYDRFRGRIMFPIFDLQDRVVGFGGRITEAHKEELKNKKGHEPAKYINTPNTLLYDKSETLYGLSKSKIEIRKANEAVLVEGYTDVICSHQIGVKNVVAVSGTALTSYQLKILSRYAKNLVTSFDMDIAGETATRRGIDMAQVYGFNIRIAQLPEGKDPADIISQNPKEWKKIIKEAKDIVNFYFEQAFYRFDKNEVEGKKQISETLLPLISRIQNKIEQSHWVEKLSHELNTKEEAIWEEMKKIAKKSTGFTQSPTDISDEKSSSVQFSKPAPAKSYKRQLKERILVLLLYLANTQQNEELEKYIEKIEKISSFLSKEENTVFKQLKEGKKSKEISGISEDLAELLSKLELQAEKIDYENYSQEEMDFCIDKLREVIQKEKAENIRAKLKKAEEKNDEEKVQHLLKKLNDLTRQDTEAKKSEETKKVKRNRFNSSSGNQSEQKKSS